MLKPNEMVACMELVNQQDLTRAEAKELIAVFLSPESAGRRYVLGCNENSIQVSQSIEIEAFIDDFSEMGKVLNGRPVIRGDEVPHEAIVVNCSLSISPVSAHRRLESLQVSGILAFVDLCSAYPDRFPYPEFVSEMRKDYEVNKSRWVKLRESLADNQSKQVLADLMRYRLTGDYRQMKAYSVRLHDQYFEEFLRIGEGEVFVDAGGFDGDTTQEFCRRYPTYGKIFFFEPSQRNLIRAKERLKDCRSVEYIQQALSDIEGLLWFNPDAGSSSAVSDSGTCQIQVTTLDQWIREKVTFIKMDLEGWELRALDGAKGHILEDHPKLAIAAYHHSADYWRIYEFVMGLRPDYDIYLRHYTEGWSESVMFFVPRLQ